MRIRIGKANAREERSELRASYASNLNEVVSEKMLKDMVVIEESRGISLRKQTFLSSLICLNRRMHVICATRLVSSMGND